MKTEEVVQQEIVQFMNAGLQTAPTLEAFKQHLARHLNHLINHDFSRLVSLLYRLDISEKKLKAMLNSTNVDAGELIADLIIERQLQKIQSRKKFSSESGSNSAEERW